MIVATRSYGQLGNRLRLYAHLMAAAKEYDVTLYFPHLREYACYFPSVRHDVWCRYPQQTVFAADELDVVSSESKFEAFQRWMVCKQVYLAGRTLSHLRCTRYPAYVIRVVDGESCDLHSNEIRKRAQSKRPLLLAGWNFRSDELLEKHSAAIREHFRVLPVHEHNVQLTIERLRRPDAKVVGVHIRHGDYKTWKGGMHFYSSEQYVQIMKQIAKENAGFETVFLVCGNADLQQADFEGLSVHFSTGHLIEDMYSLAEADMIVGPPSTFSGWASFMGNVPLLRMLRVDGRKEFIDHQVLQSIIASW